MGIREIIALEKKTGCLPIDLGVDGLAVFFEPQYKQRIVIAGIHGKTDVTYDMAIALADGLRDIAETYLEVKK